VALDVHKHFSAFTFKRQKFKGLPIEDGGNKIPQSVGNHYANYNASHPKRPQFLGTFNIYVNLFVGMLQILTEKKSNMGVVIVAPLTF